MTKNKTAKNTIADAKIASKSAIDEDDEINNQLIRILDDEFLDGEKIVKGVRLKKGRTYINMLLKLFLPFLLFLGFVMILLFAPSNEKINLTEIVVGLSISGVLLVLSLIFSLVLSHRICKNTYLVLTNKRVLLHHGVFAFETTSIDFDDIYSLKNVAANKYILTTSTKDYILINYRESDIFKLISKTLKKHQKTQN